ncbi:MAG: CpsD/CapB family tyrosine-protein kinase [Lachnospiraceae bacterium]|nr:CpsD/CapB family tyrosine-protein kinase [Lachnospiraceae bacterium]
MKTIEVQNVGALPYAMEEAVNRLRINIGFLGNDIRKIMIISTFPDEGKSTIAVNLWRQMSEAGTKSLLLDVDMRKSVFKREHLPEASEKDGFKGTSDYLAGNADIDDAVCHTQFESGDIMMNAENVVNPSILLDSERFTEMLDYFSRNYRYTFVDVPPLDLVSDGERIGSQCDGAILVIRAGVTPTGAVKATIAQLERAGCPVLGVVLNRVENSKRGYYSGHSHYGSYYGGSYYYGQKIN